MNALKLRTSRLLAPVALLCLALLTGCTATLLKPTEKETFEGIRGAWLRPDELGIEYTTHSDLYHDRIAWFKLSDVRRGPDKQPRAVDYEGNPIWTHPGDRVLRPERLERARRAPPKGAKALPLGRGVPCLPPGADIAVFVPPKGSEGTDGYYSAIVPVLSEDGKVYRALAELPCRKWLPWPAYLWLPVTVAVDMGLFVLCSPVLVVMCYREIFGMNGEDR